MTKGKKKKSFLLNCPTLFLHFKETHTGKWLESVSEKPNGWCQVTLSLNKLQCDRQRPFKSPPSVWLYWVLNRSACEYGLPVSQDAANSFHHFGIFLQQHPQFLHRSSVVLVVDDDDWEGGGGRRTRRRRRRRRRVTGGGGGGGC